MVKKYKFGEPFPTDAVVCEIEETQGACGYFRVRQENGKYLFEYTMGRNEGVYGLGEQVRGINKRGWIYESYNMDDPHITENRTALYGAHNFFTVGGGQKVFGAFFDCGGEVVFDVGYTRSDLLQVTAGAVCLYIIEGETMSEVVRSFRRLIGRSYIPPKWAFGYGQSRWGYKNEGDIRAVADGYRKNNLPLDMIYLDIDYMDRYKDFTVNKRAFPDLGALVSDMKEQNIRLIPIIDAAVKQEEGYSVYDEGVRNGYFCVDENGAPFVVGVWPGDSVLPDVLNPEARKWFGAQYRVLLDDGIEGFWNDMNEPGTFYSKSRLEEAFASVASAQGENLETDEYFRVKGAFAALANNKNDHTEMYHICRGEKIVHAEVHNLYGYHMTRAAAEYFAEYGGGKRYLLFSRSSYIGMHRYGGIWTGDNASCWAHLLLNLKMLPSLNMCGFLFVGADVGGFGENTTEDLLLRWLALAVFVPLMRNHNSGLRDQECYLFPERETFRAFLGIRYALIPYLYSEFVKCALRGEMLFRPLCFEYPADERAAVEDQLFMGESLMIAPVYEQNAAGRYVYLPERMKLVRMRSGGDFTEEIYEKGDYYIRVPLNEIVFFLREGKVLPLAKPAQSVAELDEGNLTWIKFIEKETEYELCRDDGISPLTDEKDFVRVKIAP